MFLHSAKNFSTLLSFTALGAEHPHKDICSAIPLQGACTLPLHKRIISIVWGVLSVVYILTYAFYNARARVRLAKLPYNRFRTGNLLHSWQVGLQLSPAVSVPFS